MTREGAGACRPGLACRRAWRVAVTVAGVTKHRAAGQQGGRVAGVTEQAKHAGGRGVLVPDAHVDQAADARGDPDARASSARKSLLVCGWGAAGGGVRV